MDILHPLHTTHKEQHSNSSEQFYTHNLSSQNQHLNHNQAIIKTPIFDTTLTQS